MRIAYVVYNERPASGLMKTQVIALLKEIKKSTPSIDLKLLAFWQPWVAWKHRREIRVMRTELAGAGIEQVDYPYAVIPSRYFLYNVFLFPLLHFWITLLFIVALRPRYDIVHCRGYLPSFVAAKLKSMYGHRTVFDMRSLWPKEHIAIGAWRAQDDIYSMWERIETFTVKRSDATIGVSKPMASEIRKIVPDANAVHIPICVDLDKYKFDSSARIRLREELGWSRHTVIAYQGSLGLLNSNLAEVAEYFSIILALNSDARFLILTSNRVVDVPAILRLHGIQPQSYAVRHPRNGTLADWLSAADAGIHAMSVGPDSATRLSVKVVEYLSCSLPIIVNRHVGAAADLVESHGVGIVVDADHRDEFGKKLSELFSYKKVPVDDSRALARDMFSLESCAAKYVSLYGGIAGQRG